MTAAESEGLERIQKVTVKIILKNDYIHVMKNHLKF